MHKHINQRVADLEEENTLLKKRIASIEEQIAPTQDTEEPQAGSEETDGEQS